MIFLAYALFDASSEKNSEAAVVEISLEEKKIRDAFAKFDKACEEYYKISADARDWIYVTKNPLKIFDKYCKEYYKQPSNIGIFKKDITGTDLLIDDDFRAKAEADLANINLKKYYDETLSKNEKSEANTLYDKVTKAEDELDRLSRDKSLVNAFYKVVEERYNAMSKEIRDSIKKYKENDGFRYVDLINNCSGYKEHGKKKANFEKAYQKICVYYNQMYRDKLKREKKSLPSEYVDNGGPLNQKVNQLISNYVDASPEKKSSAYDLLFNEYNASDFIYNNHKIDSDLKLYRWFVEAESKKAQEDLDLVPDSSHDNPSAPTTPRPLAPDTSSPTTPRSEGNSDSPRALLPDDNASVVYGLNSSRKLFDKYDNAQNSNTFMVIDQERNKKPKY